MNKKSQHTLFNKYFLFVFLSNNSAYITLSLCKPETYLIFSGVFGKVLTSLCATFRELNKDYLTLTEPPSVYKILIYNTVNINANISNLV